MNAISLPEPPYTDRTKRHQAMCHELAELGMELARAAARLTLTEWSAQADAPADTPTEPPPTATPAPTATPEPSATPARRRPDAALTFARVSRTVRQAIALEAHITAGPRAARPQGLHGATQTHAEPDPRRAPLREILNGAIATHPERAGLRREIAHRLDDELAANPLAQLHEILDAMTASLDVTIDMGRLPDHLLDAIIPPDAEDDEPEDADPEWDITRIEAARADAARFEASRMQAARTPLATPGPPDTT